MAAGVAIVVVGAGVFTALSFAVTTLATGVFVEDEGAGV